MRLKIYKHLTGVVFVAFALAACNKNTDDAPAPALASANVAVVHAIPDAGSINFYMDGTRQTTYKISYLQSSGYISVPSGQHNTSVADTTYATIGSYPVNLKPAYSYTLLVAGKLSTNSINSILLYDTSYADNVRRKPKMRFVNASAGSSPVDVYINSSVFSNIAFKSVSGYIRADTGKVTLKVNLAGTSTTILSSTITLLPASVYTLFAYGFQNGSGKTGYNLALITNH